MLEKFDSHDTSVKNHKCKFSCFLQTSNRMTLLNYDKLLIKLIIILCSVKLNTKLDIMFKVLCAE